jgi:hypothetical protein
MNLMSMANTIETITTDLLHRKRNEIFANRSVAAGLRQTNKNQIRQERSFCYYDEKIGSKSRDKKRITLPNKHQMKQKQQRDTKDVVEGRKEDG